MSYPYYKLTSFYVPTIWGAFSFALCRPSVCLSMSNKGHFLGFEVICTQYLSLNTQDANRINRFYCHLLFSVPYKCLLVCLWVRPESLWQRWISGGISPMYTILVSCKKYVNCWTLCLQYYRKARSMALLRAYPDDFTEASFMVRSIFLISYFILYSF